MTALELLCLALVCYLAAGWTTLLAYQGGNVSLWFMSLGFAVAGLTFAVRAKKKL